MDSSRLHFFFLALLFLLLSGCAKNEDKVFVDSKGEFRWKEDLSPADLPEHPLKGSLNGKEIQFQYVNFETWRGSNDNVLNFSSVKPSQPCGYNEGFQGFQLIKKGQTMAEGTWTKETFGSDPGNYESYFRFSKPDGSFYRSGSRWNCVLMIEKISNGKAIGKIAICFDEKSKSWIAGKFEAIICSN